jgi:Fe-S-cluster-containing dehydrogenase component
MPRAVTYLSSKCDLCIGRLSGSENPVCIASCPYGALEYVEINQADQEDMHFVNDNFVVRYISWKNPKSQEI